MDNTHLHNMVSQLQFILSHARQRLQMQQWVQDMRQMEQQPASTPEPDALTAHPTPASETAHPLALQYALKDALDNVVR